MRHKNLILEPKRREFRTGGSIRHIMTNTIVVIFRHIITNDIVVINRHIMTNTIVVYDSYVVCSHNPHCSKSAA